jgi:hypothetical protein
VTLTVTRDYGAEVMVEATVSDPSESDTVLRALDRVAEITTRYGGGFVQSIEGVEGTVRDGRTLDWFFYVDGIESPVGSAEREVRAGHRIWWDHRDWTDAMRVPAVVGSWPEPFAQAAAEERLPVRIGCWIARRVCEAVGGRLTAAGAPPARIVRESGAGTDAIRILVGPWARVRDDPVAARVDRGPAHSGVFARFTGRRGGYELLVLDETAAPAAELGPGGGLVAALREGDDPPTWVVTGTDRAGVRAAVELLDAERLEDRYAVATEGAGGLRLPVVGEAE